MTSTLEPENLKLWEAGLKLRGFLFAMTFLCFVRAWAANENFQVAASVDMGFPSAKELNEYRSNLSSSNVDSKGHIGQMTGYSVSLGHAVGKGVLSLQYSSSAQVLPDSDYMYTTLKVQNRLYYSAAYLIYDYPVYQSNGLIGTVGAGVGKSLKFEYHEEMTGGGTEDIVWEGTAVPTKVRLGLINVLSANFQLILEAQYEMVSSELKASKSYAHSINGSAISEGDPLRSGGKNVKADLSGLRLSAGVAILF